MPYLKITHDSELCFNENDGGMKVLCQKLYDIPFRTYVHCKPTKSLKPIKKSLVNQGTTVQSIRFKELERETRGLM